MPVMSSLEGHVPMGPSTSLEKDIHEMDRPSTANPFRRARSISQSIQWRRPHVQRPKSLVFTSETEGLFSESLSSQGVEEEVPEVLPQEAKPDMTLKGKIRRASLTLAKGLTIRRDRRNSEPGSDQEEQPLRPSTAHSTWHKLRQATSFRHCRMHSRGALETIYSPVESTFPAVPVPGSGTAPPIIPRHTGAAAKASAALQNQYLAFSQQTQDQSGEESQNDRESGIGIAVTMTEIEVPATPQAQISSFSRVDFIAELPLELAAQVLSHLDARNLLAASRVSKSWNQMIKDQHIWRQSFLRETAGTFATSEPVPAGKGLGVPPIRPGNDWRKIYKAKQELDRRWQQGNGARPIYLSGHIDSIYCLQFDESKIITGSRDKTIRIWDMHTFQCRLVIGPPEVINETHVLFDTEGKPMHFASTPDNDRSNESVPATVSFGTHHKASILCLQYDDRILVTGSSDSTCIVYGIKSGYRPIRRLEHHTAAVLDLAFDDKHIVTCSKDFSICVWDRETGMLVKQLRGHNGPVNAVQMRGNAIVSCSGDFRVKLWNIDSGKVIREFEGHTKGLACSQFSEDGRFIASAGSDKVIRIWNANTGECMHEIQAHEALVRSLHIDSVSGRLVSGSYDTDIKVFDMETGAKTLDFPKWHQSWVLSAKSDYRRIVSTGQDPKILIMDFGADVEDICMLESVPLEDVARGAGFI